MEITAIIIIQTVQAVSVQGAWMVNAEVWHAIKELVQGYEDMHAEIRSVTREETPRYWVMPSLILRG